MEPLVVTVDEAAHVLKISKAKIYELMASGELESAHFGRSRRIPVASVRLYLETNTQGRDLPYTEDSLDNAPSGATVGPHGKAVTNGGVSGSSARPRADPAQAAQEARSAGRGSASRSRQQVEPKRRDRRAPRAGAAGGGP